MPHGIWGEIARQLGKKVPSPHTTPRSRRRGGTAWINLLKGEPTLILIDELPPYLDNAKSIAVGSSDLSRMTATALTNLFEAVAERELANVCVVLTDLARHLRRGRTRSPTSCGNSRTRPSGTR